MKKMVLGLMLVTATVGSYAQSNSLGINGGFGQSAIKNFKTYQGYTDAKYMPHGNVGLSFVHSTKTNFGFGADVKYSWEGAKKSGVNPTEQTLSVQYVRVPVKLIYFFGKYGQRLRPKAYVGPSVGFLVAAKQTTKTGSTSSGEIDVKDGLNGSDIGFIAGAGINYRLVKNTWFTADLNYYNSFRDIREANSTGKRLSNNNVALNIGVMWGIGK